MNPEIHLVERLDKIEVSRRSESRIPTQEK
jgi:hypothetical protein